MKLPQINKRQVSAVLLTVAALMLLDSLYQLGMHIRWRCWIPSSLAIASSATQPASTQPLATQPVAISPASHPASSQTAASQPSATQSAGSQTSAAQPVPKQPDARWAGPTGAGPSAPKPLKPHELAAAIKKRNIMAEAKPKGHGLTLSGVLDNMVFLRTREGQDASIEEGKSGPGGVKVTKIDGITVTIEYEGKLETLKLFADAPGSPPSPAAGGGEPPARNGPTAAASSGPTPPLAKPAGTSQPAGAASQLAGSSTSQPGRT